MGFSGGQFIILVVGIIVVGAILILFISALLSIAKADISGAEKAVWILIALFFPFLGPLIWFFMRGAAAKNQSTRGLQSTTRPLHPAVMASRRAECGNTVRAWG
jgi:hypothetical protein